MEAGSVRVPGGEASPQSGAGGEPMNPASAPAPAASPAPGAAGEAGGYHKVIKVTVDRGYVVLRIPLRLIGFRPLAAKITIVSENEVRIEWIK